MLAFIVYCGILFFGVESFIDMKKAAKDQETQTTTQYQEIQEEPIMDPLLTAGLFLF